MARPEMESRVEDRNPGAPQSCRMEVLRQDAWQSGSIIQPCHRHRTIATQTSTLSGLLPHIPTPGAFISPSMGQQQDNPLRNNIGTEQEISSPRERQLPLPGQQLDNHSSSDDSMSSRSAGGDNPRLEDQVVERVAIQLRTIGDEMNAVLLQRNAAPHWHNWRGVYHGLIALVADTINGFYQHGFR
ncbi:bcl-2-binding component 3 [Xyrauchen texanus]|uniref:bcl-2-binding component 3 n=1 Tax=Xyrauchen texanus TaxID=154827 RepID=UPI002242ADE0|nr:bcl-2-binding component 3 [Xyrauchen texanus]